MRYLLLGSAIVGFTPLISSIAVANSWLSSLDVSSVLPSKNFVCRKVSTKISGICQEPTLLLDNKVKFGIQPYMLTQMTNFLVPQWNLVSQKIRNITEQNNPSSLSELRDISNNNSQLVVFNQDSLPPDSSNNITDSSVKETLKSTKIKAKKPNFPKFSRSSLLVSYLHHDNGATIKQDQCDSVTNCNFTHPAPYTKRVASPFGWRIRPYSGQYQFHQGIDYGAPLGSPVVAAADGIVTKVVSGCSDFRDRLCGNQFGNWIEIDHGNGAIALYGHLLHKSITVKEGMKIWKNQEIAQVGSSGWSTGAHLDFRVKINGKYQNPTQFIRESTQRF